MLSKYLLFYLLVALEGALDLVPDPSLSLLIGCLLSMMRQVSRDLYWRNWERFSLDNCLTAAPREDRWHLAMRVGAIVARRDVQVTIAIGAAGLALTSITDRG